LINGRLEECTDGAFPRHGANEAMATRSLTNSPGSPRKTPSGALREEDYRTFCAALESTQRGRDFLVEYTRRNRNADTEILLDSLDRIETMMRAEGAARDRLQDELRVLLIAIRLARPDINSATALTKAARLVDLLDMMERRIDAMVENKDLPPITEEPLPALAALSVVPRPDEPELPIPSFASMLPPPPIALVQHVTNQDLPKQELPKQDAGPQARAPEPALQEVATPEVAKQEAPQETAIQLAAQEALIKARRGLPAEPYALFSEEEAVAPAPEEKWLPDFGGDEAQIIHTQPVRSMAFMPEVTFAPGPPAVPKAEVAPVVAKAAFVAPALADIVVETEVVAEAAVVAPAAEPAPAVARLRDHPLSAIMSLSEEERIALFT
jgi:hypothetical protein